MNVVMKGANMEGSELQHFGKARQLSRSVWTIHYTTRDKKICLKRISNILNIFSSTRKLM